MGRHHCHYFGCPTATDPKLLFCPKHWGMVKPVNQQEVYSTFREGKKNGTHPSNKWMLATEKAALDVATVEIHPLQEKRIAHCNKFIDIYEERCARDAQEDSNEN